MDLSKLNDDQIKVALKVIESARKYGINPDFVLSMVNTESGFKQDAVSPKGAIGVMQLMPETAKGLKVNPSNIDENIDGGMRLLKELTQDKRIGNDPFKLLVGYNTSSETRKKFFESDNIADLPDETVKHVLQVMRPFGENVPSISFTPSAEAKQEADTQGGQDAEDQYGGDVVPEGRSDEETQAEKSRSAKEVGVIGATLGTGAGSLYTAKMPLVRLASRAGLLPGGKPISPSEAAALVERTMSPTPPDTSPRKTHGGENWQKSLTGISTPGAQMDKASLDLGKRMQQTVGIGGAPGFTGGMITEGGVILNPRDAAAIQARVQAQQQIAAEQAARNEAVYQRRMEQANRSDPIQRGVRNFAGSAPVRGGLAGLGMGYNVQDAYNKFQEGDKLSGSLSTGAAGASGLSLVPKFTPVMGPLAVGLTTASQVAGDIRRGDKQSAAESGLTGLTAMFPRLFGPFGGLVYSRGLNAGEEEELARRRQMAPTISP